MFRDPAPAPLNQIKLKVAGLAWALVGGFLLQRGDLVAASPVLDQFNPVGASLYGVAPTETWQQGIRAGISGTLSSISLYGYEGKTFDFYINLGTPWQSDTHNFQARVTVPQGTWPGWFSINVSAANIQLLSGTSYVIGAKGESYLLGSDNTYSRGALWSSVGYPAGFPTPSTGDLAFATYMIPVPEPTTLALFGAGAVALALSRRR